MQSTMYRICIRGRLTETGFTGEIRGQSQLYGQLDRVRDLGLELVSVQRSPLLTRRPTIRRRPISGQLRACGGPMYSGAVKVARHISQREAVGEITADQTKFSDSARYVSLCRLSSPHALGEPCRILLHTSRSSRACRARVRCDRRQPVPKVHAMTGMYRDARTY